ncbi:hypothetical protein D9M71_141140 [compost metagenome]
MFDDQTLGGGTDLASIGVAADDRGFDRLVEVGIVENDERIGTAQLQHAFFQRGTGLGTDGHTGAHAAGQGHGGDARVLDSLGHTVGGDVDDFEHTLRQAGLLDHVEQQVGAAHHVRRVLEDIGVAGDQRRDGTAQHLPDREVPRHYRQDRAQWPVFDARLAIFHQGRFGAEHARALGGVPLAQLCAFLHFATGLGQRLAHFQGDHPRHGRCVVTDGAGQGKDQPGALGHSGTPPVRKTACSPRQRCIEVRLGLVRVVTNGFAVGGVDRHGMGMAGERGHGTVLQKIRERRQRRGLFMF